MTEDEAKTKWCPHVRFADCGADNASSVNRDGMFMGDINKCIASDCMMWKWDEAITETDGGEIVGTNYNTQGHCGLTNEH